ncbi:hypothetical protein AX16_007933 [Volvariella volvacea WC 439]|nr:hypothetical protein AX16_007933 [Volvariella volvacea WC 439]
MARTVITNMAQQQDANASHRSRTPAASSSSGAELNSGVRPYPRLRFQAHALGKAHSAPPASPPPSAPGPTTSQSSIQGLVQPQKEQDAAQSLSQIPVAGAAAQAGDNDNNNVDDVSTRAQAQSDPQIHNQQDTGNMRTTATATQMAQDSFVPSPSLSSHQLSGTAFGNVERIPPGSNANRATTAGVGTAIRNAPGGGAAARRRKISSTTTGGGGRLAPSANTSSKNTTGLYPHLKPPSVLSPFVSSSSYAVGASSARLGDEGPVASQRGQAAAGGARQPRARKAQGKPQPFIAYANHFRTFLRKQPLWGLILGVLFLSFVFKFLRRGTLKHHFSPGDAHDIIHNAQGLVTPRQADFPSLASMQTLHLTKLLQGSSDRSELVLEMKKVEMAGTDLMTVVEHSNLLTIKGAMKEMLKDVMEDVKEVGVRLRGFNTNIEGAIGQITVINNDALITLESTHSQRRLNALLTRKFTESMSALSNELTRLMVSAQLSLQSLTSLKEHLGVLDNLVQMDGVVRLTGPVSHISAGANLDVTDDAHSTAAKHYHKNILADIWAFYGGNRPLSIGGGVDNHHQTLMLFGSFMTQAESNIEGAIKTLGDLAREVEELRARVAIPPGTGARVTVIRGSKTASEATDGGTRGRHGGVSVEAQMASIRTGLEKLKEAKERAKVLQDMAVRRALDGMDDDFVKVN